PTAFTWIIAIFGLITFLPLIAAQILMLLNPNSRRTKDVIIGKGKNWRDKTHVRSALAFAWADILIMLPLLILGSIGVTNGQIWGYIIWTSLGVLSIYFSIIFWVMEKKYTYPAYGWLAYYTYFWGFFLYWGLAAIAHSIYQMSNAL
ncbi:MAG: hypothetical protein OEQ53_17965, partial [Saprospiraceae bacterium]|nr:hypothetical protein [Saprospiraceae bacterium]